MPMKTIWIRVPPHSDPFLAGKAIVHKPWAPNRCFTERPEEVEYSSDIIRMIIRGDLIECESPGLAAGPPPSQSDGKGLAFDEATDNQEIDR